MLSHFLSDLVHFEGKFFSTINALFRKPGFVAEEYRLGRRKRYIDPARMYIFTSAFFFIILFNWDSVSSILPTKTTDSTNSLVTVTVTPPRSQTADTTGSAADTVGREKNEGTKILLEQKKELARLFVEGLYETDSGTFDVRTIAEYDSLQRLLPASERDLFFERFFMKRMLEGREYAFANPYLFITTILDKLVHTLSQIIIISLPLFAFFLFLLYFPKREKYYYVSHVIFTIHLYCTVFILFITSWIVSDLGKIFIPYFSAFMWLAFFVSALFYLYRGMRNFYKENRWLTFIKFLAINILATICILALGIIYAYYSITAAFTAIS